MKPAPPGVRIAGIGASAGGLEAMLPLLAGLPRTGCLAYVVAQHMAKDGHDDLVVRLLNRDATLPVVLGRSMDQLQPDTVYVIPSGVDGVVQNGKLVLREAGTHNISTPSVNTLFQSIASSEQRHGMGIVLSGTAYDGVAGCKALKAQGAWTLAQDPVEAKFDGMPRAAIEAGAVDQVLTVEAIAAQIAERFPHTPSPSIKPAPRVPHRPPSLKPALHKPASTTTAPEPTSELRQLLALVHQATGIDFSSYKEDTLIRRLKKRMESVGIGSLAAYLAWAPQQPEELKQLQQMFLVSVSSFFRDAASFAALGATLQRQMAKKPAGEPVRVWVPGCAGGEEPYTLAMLLTELTHQHPIQIVATDLNPDALAVAERAVYRPAAFKDMDPLLRQRYTQAQGPDLEVVPAIRACVRFERRDVLAPPSTTGLDLVSCRNLLIYMKTALQDRLIGAFHRTLRPQGLLFIGQSESLSFVGNSLFTPIDHYHRLFRRRNVESLA